MIISAERGLANYPIPKLSKKFLFLSSNTRLNIIDFICFFGDYRAVQSKWPATFTGRSID